MSMIKLAWADIIKTLKNPKSWIIILLCFFFLSSDTREIREIAVQYDLGVSPYVYPIFMTSWQGRMYALILIVMLMSEAPFYNGSELFVNIRINRYKWFTSKLIYIVSLSVVFQIMMIIMSVLVFGTYVGWDNQWGDVITTYIRYIQGMTSAGGYIKGVDIVSLNPMKIMGYEFVLMVLISIIIGLLTFVLNGVLKSFLGTVIMGVLVLFDIYLVDLSGIAGVNLKYSLPTSWIDINFILSDVNLSIGKCTIYMVFIVLLLVAVCYFLVSKRVIRPVRNV